MLEITGLLFGGTNISARPRHYVEHFITKGYWCFKFKVDIGIGKERFPRKRNDISSVQNFLISHPRPNPFKNNHPGEGWIKVKEKFLSALVMCELHLILHLYNH